MLLLSGFRLLLFFTNISAVKNESLATVLTGFGIGLQFDSVISCYLLGIPFLLLSLHQLFPIQAFIKLTRTMVIVLYSLTFFLVALDIPFFNHFNTRLHTGVFLWLNDLGFSIKMILQEPSFYLYLIPIIGVTVLFYHLEKKQAKNLSTVAPQSLPQFILIFLLLAGLLTLGMRGRIAEKSPIRAGSSYYCENHFLNKLGLNPLFSLGTSILNDLTFDYKDIHLIDNTYALDYARHYLHSNDTIGLSRIEKRSGNPHKKNVVVVIMESMCEIYRGQYDGPSHKTPYLNQLEQESLSFKQTYSSGIHTFNGIYSTIYSMPALFKQHPLELYLHIPHYALPQVLLENGYSTTYFTTHDSEFDNVGGFLRAHGFQKVFSESNYPSEEIKSTMGIPDHLLFEHAIDEFKNDTTKPFFAVLMTGSLHKPYILPENIPFKSKSASLDEQIIEYADWSIHHFIELAKSKPWFDNTLFVFVADHGHSYGHTYDMPLSGNRIPFFIYSPNYIQPEQRNQLATQIDIGPTLLHLLNIEYENTTLGMDLLNYNHPSIFFSADDRIGCLDTTFYWFRRSDGRESLYQYKNLSPQDHSQLNPKTLNNLKHHSLCMLQSAQYLYNHHLLGKRQNK